MDKFKVIKSDKVGWYKLYKRYNDDWVQCAAPGFGEMTHSFVDMEAVHKEMESLKEKDRTYAKILSDREDWLGDNVPLYFN